MPGIVKGSILKFQSQVKVPSAGSAFSTLQFTDEISQGLAYIQTPPTVVEYKAVTAADYTDITSTSTPAYDAGTNILTISIPDGAVTNPSQDVLVRITFYVVVTDPSLAIVNSKLTNTAKFKMLDGTGSTVGDEVSITINPEMTNYSFHVMGVPVTIPKDTGEKFDAVYFFGAMSGEANNLSYKLTIKPNPNFDFLPGVDPDYEDVKVKIGSYTGTEADRTVTVVPANDPSGLPENTIIVTIPHTSAMCDKVLHLIIPTESNANIVTADEPQFIFGDGQLIDNTSKTLATADHYNVQVNFTAKAKELEGLSKELILS